VFKIKLKELINDIHKKHILGCTIVGIYVIEFQKRGLPHAHIFIFFTKDYKPHMVKDVDQMISAELPNSETNKLAHEMVARCMMHGLCGAMFPNAPCMEEGKCEKQYPCKFQSEIVMDVNRYPIYRCRDTGLTILVHGIELDNRWVVPHNVYLSTKYDAHINVEVCNNIHAIKYVFKYVYKRHDRATVKISRQSDNAIEGMWSKPMKLKNISTVAFSSLICMSGFLLLSVCNSICPISKWCCLTMMMMCKKWQHNQPFPERCSQNGSKQTKNRKLHEALHSINSLSNGCGIGS
jgi:hypothetical protein